MANNDTFGSQPADRSDWNNAWEVVSRLAAAREAALQGADADRRNEAIRGSASLQANASAAADVSAHPVAAIEPDQIARAVAEDQIARAVAEIEKASAALRRAEPALEAWHPSSAIGREKRSYLSVWILVGGLWISATLVVAGATGAILYLFG